MNDDGSYPFLRSYFYIFQYAILYKYKVLIYLMNYNAMYFYIVSSFFIVKTELILFANIASAVHWSHFNRGKTQQHQIHVYMYFTVNNYFISPFVSLFILILKYCKVLLH